MRLILVTISFFTIALFLRTSSASEDIAMPAIDAALNKCLSRILDAESILKNSDLVVTHSWQKSPGYYKTIGDLAAKIESDLGSSEDADALQRREAAKEMKRESQFGTLSSTSKFRLRGDGSRAIFELLDSQEKMTDGSVIVRQKVRTLQDGEKTLTIYEQIKQASIGPSGPIVDTEADRLFSFLNDLDKLNLKALFGELLPVAKIREEGEELILLATVKKDIPAPPYRQNWRYTIRLDKSTLTPKTLEVDLANEGDTLAPYLKKEFTYTEANGQLIPTKVTESKYNNDLSGKRYLDTVEIFEIEIRSFLETINASELAVTLPKGYSISDRFTGEVFISGDSMKSIEGIMERQGEKK